MKNSSSIPFFIDATEKIINFPQPNDPAPDTPEEYLSSHPTRGQGITRAVIDRHVDHANVLFLDLAVSPVGLKKLWTLRWHKDWQVDPTVRDGSFWDGIEWMKNMKGPYE